MNSRPWCFECRDPRRMNLTAAQSNTTLAWKALIAAITLWPLQKAFWAHGMMIFKETSCWFFVGQTICFQKQILIFHGFLSVFGPVQELGWVLSLEGLFWHIVREGTGTFRPWPNDELNLAA